MGMPATTARWTRAMLEALPEDGKRHEIIDGVHYVTPSPETPHQFVHGRLYGALYIYLEGERIGWLFSSPSDVDLGADTIVQPDLFIVRRSGDRPPRLWRDIGVPILAVEILSPSTMGRDRLVKRRRYQRAGIAEYWIVDQYAQLVERWRPEDERPEIITELLTWRPDGAHAALEVDLRPIFEAVAPDEQEG